MSMNDERPTLAQDIGDLYADINACLLAIASTLEKKGLLTNAELREAAQERRQTMVELAPQHPFVLLSLMATEFPSNPDD